MRTWRQSIKYAALKLTGLACILLPLIWRDHVAAMFAKGMAFEAVATVIGCTLAGTAFFLWGEEQKEWRR